jgi:cell division protein FtsB
VSGLGSDVLPDASGSSVPTSPRPPKPPAVKGGSFTGRALVLALVAATLLLTLAVPVRAWFAQRAEIAGLRADVDAARERVASLQVQKQRWDDPSFVAAEARRRLHFVLPGEIGFVTLGSPADLAAAAADQGPQVPWYSSLWGALQEADDHAAKPAAS